jgi:hypothetical protein
MIDMKSPSLISVSTLATLAGLSARRIEQLINEGVLPSTVEHGELPFEQALIALFRHFRSDRESLAQERLLKLKAQRIRAERINEEEQSVRTKRWMESGLHFAVIRLVTDILERVPERAQAELGLTSQATVALRRLIDEARTSAAAAVRDFPQQPTDATNVSNCAQTEREAEIDGTLYV